MSTLDLLVNRKTLRQALAAVLPHSGGVGVMGRVRLTPLSGSQLLVSAGDGYTVAAARADIDDVLDLPELAPVDVEPKAVRDILAVFTPPKGADDRVMWLEEAFRVRVTPSEVVVDEAGTLVEGRTLTVPRLPVLDEHAETGYVDVPGRIAHYLTAPITEPADTAISTGFLTRFIASAKAVNDSQLDLAYRTPARGSAAFTVSAGQGDVVGLLLPIRRPKDVLDQANAITDHWASLLAPIGRPAPAPHPLRAALREA